jgi:hypothetical protein
MRKYRRALYWLDYVTLCLATAFAGLSGQSLAVRGACAWNAASAGVERRRDGGTGAVDVVLQWWQPNAWRILSPAWGKGVHGRLR